MNPPRDEWAISALSAEARFVTTPPTERHHPDWVMHHHRDAAHTADQFRGQ
jgi:hypothetical protein